MRIVVGVCLLASGIATADEKHTVEKLDKLPKGLSPGIVEAVQPAGLRVRGGEKGDKTVCEVWLAKKVPVQKGFEKSFNVTYPFRPGQLIGILRVPTGTVLGDFRGQEIKAGVYTLRYGRQPEDGNHIGTSETADFLLALPAGSDKSAKAVSSEDSLNTQSAEAAGSTHPAIFSLLPVEEPNQHGKLTRDENYDFLILNAHVPSSAKPVPIRMVVIGKSDA